MSKPAKDDAAENYVVVVRNRRGGGDDDHHGGAWKIAYADFMTAMMAFFLVMWLINATDEKTIVQVATYFNPLRLSDKVPSQKGLHEGTNESRSGAAKGGPSETGTPKPSAEAAKKDVASSGEAKKKGGKKKSEGDADSQLFADPFAALDKLAAKAMTLEPPSEFKDKPGGQPPPPAGDVLRDPYEPSPQPKRGESVKLERGVEPALPKEITNPKGELKGATSPGDVASVTPTGPLPPPAETISSPAKSPPGKSEPKDSARQLETAIRHAVADLGVVHPMLSVTATSEGILIDLTDNANFSMFAVGSAEPRPELVAVMARIGNILQRQSGAVVVKGHTDGRPYRTASYDNWRLSSARAHMASYMLIRGGLSDNRIERIEGHADRNLKIPIEKEAAQNRRIEILLKMAPT